MNELAPNPDTPRTDRWDKFDGFERAIASSLPHVEMPLGHVFTPGLYTRTIFMPAGTLVTSKIHKFEHPYMVTSGVVLVWIDGVGWKKIVAPHMGITKPGTRRVLFIVEDCTWTTFHATDLTDPDEVVRAVTEDRASHLEGVVRPEVALEGVDLSALLALPEGDLS